MSRPSSLIAMRIIRAEFHQVSVVEASTVGTFHHGRLFCFMRLRIHDDIRLPHVVREAAALVALHDVLYWDIPASYTSGGGHPHDYAGTGLPFSAIGDVLALLEVAEWSQGPVQVLKLLI
jgi:hypothetical protein